MADGWMLFEELLHSPDATTSMDMSPKQTHPEVAFARYFVEVVRKAGGKLLGWKCFSSPFSYLAVEQLAFKEFS